MIRKVREALDHLYMEYESFSNNYMSMWFNETRSLSSVREEAEDSLFGNVRAKRAVVGFQRFLEEEANTTNKSEIDIYLDEGCENQNGDFDILGWWKNNVSKYKTLSMMARDVLAIPFSTVALESAFSVGGRVLDQFHTSLTPKIAEALICTRDWLHGTINLEVEENLEELEELETGILDQLVLDD
ncbi:hypothetical protein Scep_002225 [Stephania cephalantha]|uniref:HAT C-terminal dimerisation domain-containing protein n=1 Tax=Stephania cephalantha TaxID=152367 RepID=A0AAP0Q5S1_9MAGN